MKSITQDQLEMSGYLLAEVSASRRHPRVARMMYRTIFTLVFAIVFIDAQNDLGLRTPLLAGLGLLWLYGLYRTVGGRETDVLLIVLCFVLPSWGLIVYVSRGDGSFPIEDTSYIGFALVCSLAFVIRTAEAQAAYTWAAVFCGVVYSLLLFVVANEHLILEQWAVTGFLIDNNIARVDVREYSAADLPYIYFYTSTLLLVPILLLIEKIEQRRALHFALPAVLLMIASFFLSGTRSHIIMSCGFMALLAMRSRGFLRAAVWVTLVVVVIPNLLVIYSTLLEMLDGGAPNNAIKIAMLGVYADIFSDILTILVGQGFEAAQWSRELRSMLSAEGAASKTELTFLEIFRVFGFLVGGVVMGLLAWRVVSGLARPSLRYKALMLGALLFDAMFNPHLFSTYGATIVALALSPQPTS